MRTNTRSLTRLLFVTVTVTVIATAGACGGDSGGSSSPQLTDAERSLFCRDMLGFIGYHALECEAYMPECNQDLANGCFRADNPSAADECPDLYGCLVALVPPHNNHSVCEIKALTAGTAAVGADCTANSDCGLCCCARSNTIWDTHQDVPESVCRDASASDFHDAGQCMD